MWHIIRSLFVYLDQTWESQTHKFMILGSFSEASKEIKKDNSSFYIKGFILIL